jgi:hypothetical protein
MMRRSFMPIGDRPTTRIVYKTVRLPDGRVLQNFPVVVADPPENNFADNKVGLSNVDEHGRVPQRGASS